MSTLALPTSSKRPLTLALPGSQAASVSNSPAPTLGATGLSATQPHRASSLTIAPVTGTNGRAESGRASASPSPDPDDDVDADGDDDDEEALKKAKNAKKKKSGAAVGLPGADNSAKPDYKYTNEISQMVRRASQNSADSRRCSCLERYKIRYLTPFVLWKTLFAGKLLRLCVANR